MCCLGDGLSHQPSVGTGTVMRTDTFTEYAQAAGFHSRSTSFRSRTTSSASTSSATEFQSMSWSEAVAQLVGGVGARPGAS